MQSTTHSVSEPRTLRRSLGILRTPTMRPTLTHDCRERTEIIAIAILLAIIAAGLALMLLAGCAAGTTGTFRPVDAQVESTITNTVATVMAVNKAVVPFPWNTIFEAAGGAGLTLLAAWQAMTHRTVQDNKAAIATINSKPNA